MVALMNWYRVLLAWIIFLGFMYLTLGIIYAIWFAIYAWNNLLFIPIDFPNLILLLWAIRILPLYIFLAFLLALMANLEGY